MSGDFLGSDPQGDGLQPAGKLSMLERRRDFRQEAETLMGMMPSDVVGLW